MKSALLLLALLTLSALVSAARPPPPTAVPRKKDWTKVKDADLQNVVESFEDDDPDNPLIRGPHGQAMPKGKTEMGFVTLRKEFCKSKQDAEIIAFKWTELLKTNGVEARPYAIDENRLIFVVDKGMMKMLEVRSFVLDQGETESFELSNRNDEPSPKGFKAFQRMLKQRKAAELKAAKDAEAAAAKAETERLENEAAEAARRVAAEAEANEDAEYRAELKRAAEVAKRAAEEAEAEEDKAFAAELKRALAEEKEL